MANDKGGTDNISLIILSKPLDLEIKPQKQNNDAQNLEEFKKEVSDDLDNIKKDLPEFFKEKETVK